MSKVDKKMYLPLRGNTSVDGRGIGVERPAELTKEDDEYDAYRKRMMLAYRFRPNPLVRMTLMNILSHLGLFSLSLIVS